MEPNDFTTLVLDGIGVAPYTARGITQTLEPIEEASHLERAIDGTIIDLGIPELQKYRVSITCTDQQAPALSGIWPGKAFTLHSIEELSFPTSTPALKERDSVPDSEYVVGDFTFYRPILPLRVYSWSTQINEYGREINWKLEAQEDNV